MMTAGRKIEKPFNFFGDFSVINFNLRSSVSININTNRFSNANGIGNLNQYFIGNSGSYHILGYMPHGISG